MNETYSIVRFYAPHLNKPRKVIKTGLTLEEAQEHCNNPETRKEGQWFDGYKGGIMSHNLLRNALAMATPHTGYNTKWLYMPQKEPKSVSFSC